MCPLILFAFYCLLTFEYFGFCQLSVQNMPLKMFSLFFFFFTSPTVVVTFYSNVVLLFVFCLSIICLLLWKSYTIMYVWSGVYWWTKKKYKKCQLICKTNYQSVMTWTTPLMTVNDWVVMWRGELAVFQLDPSLRFIIALLLWSLTGYFGLLEENVILIS